MTRTAEGTNPGDDAVKMCKNLGRVLIVDQDTSLGVRRFNFLNSLPGNEVFVRKSLIGSYICLSLAEKQSFDWVVYGKDFFKPDEGLKILEQKLGLA